MQTPFCTVADAIASITAANATATIYLKGALPHSIPSTLLIQQGRSLALVSWTPLASAAIEGPGPNTSQPIFEVAPGATLILDRVQASNASSAIFTQGNVWLHQVELTGVADVGAAAEKGSGIVQTAGTVWLHRSQVMKYNATGITSSGVDSKLFLDATIVAKNGNNDSAASSGISLSSGAQATISFSTLFLNYGSNDGKQIRCDSDTASLAVRASIVVGDSSNTVSKKCTGENLSFTHSVHDDTELTADIAPECLTETDFNVYHAWFVDTGAGDLRLKKDTTAAISMVAKVTSADQTLDIDGDMLPPVDYLTYPGADQPK